MVDLSKFCGAEDSRFYLQKPWSRDGWTYASNGYILARVPLAQSIPDEPGCPDAAKVIAMVAGQSVSPLNLSLPEPEFEDCDCNDGKAHSCPGCTCPCYQCAGTGRISLDSRTSVLVRGVNFSLAYVRLLTTLPGVQFTTEPPTPQPNTCVPSRFSFDGGEGALMPLRHPYERRATPA